MNYSKTITRTKPTVSKALDMAKAFEKRKMILFRNLKSFLVEDDSFDGLGLPNIFSFVRQ